MGDKVQFIASFADDLKTAVLNFDRSSVFNALIMCLPPEEACGMFDLTFEQAYQERRAIVRKLQRDMANDVKDCHELLVDTLVSELQALPARRRASAAGTLLSLAGAMDSPQEQRALETVCAAPQATVRRRAYTYLRHTDENVPLLECVARAFDTYADPEAAKLLAYRAPQELLLSRFDALVDALAGEKFALSRLFMRVCASDSALLERLQAINPVSHAYVCAKLGIQLSDSHMVELYRTTMFSDESGLVAWCCGQMGLWSALEKIASLSQNPPEDAYRRFRDAGASA
ncbi:MAG: hypothetical protein RBS17_01745 [Coriobacteriia bacterium]|nr:hypothetical protein [Coriobacteriia bacterium]